MTTRRKQPDPNAPPPRTEWYKGYMKILFDRRQEQTLTEADEQRLLQKAAKARSITAAE